MPKLWYTLCGLTSYWMMTATHIPSLDSSLLPVASFWISCLKNMKTDTLKLFPINDLIILAMSFDYHHIYFIAKQMKIVARASNILA